MDPVVSCVTPVYNAARFLPALLDALAAQTFRGAREFVFADNGCTDDSRAVIEAWRERLGGPVRIVDAFARRGAAHAMNTGWRAARAPLLVFCDADDRPGQDWMAGLVRAAEAEGADIVSGGTRLWDGSPGPNPEPVWNACAAVHLGFLPMVLNGNMLARAPVLAALGGWAEDFRTGEDAEFSWRAQLAGFRIVAAGPEVVLDYRSRPDARSAFAQYFRFGLDDIKLLRRFRGHPRPPRGWAERRREWAVHGPRLRRILRRREHTFDRLDLARFWGKKAGHFCGSILHRHWFF